MSPTPNEFSRIIYGSSQESYRTHSEEAGGESGQVEPSLTYPATPTTQVPTPGDPELQFSEDKASTPEAMASETSVSQSAFSELQQYLNNSLETLGACLRPAQWQRW